MSAQELRMERHVSAAPESVWQVLTDLDSAAETLSGVTRVEVLTDGPYAEGTRWRETRKMFGKEATEEMRVTGVQAPTRTTVEADSGGVHYVTVFTLAPESGGTRLEMTFTAEQPQGSVMQKLMWTAFGKLGMKATAKVMTQDLDDIARRAESSHHG
ncbi:MAG TPA: SRPBCC family protein [Nocardioidaceae bacterium]|nr:SRPBCC family protein [Nocardioidaceae bacterium]